MDFDEEGDFDHLLDDIEAIRAHTEEEEERAKKTAPYITVNGVSVVFCCSKMEKELMRNKTIRTYKWEDETSDEHIVIYAHDIIKVIYCPFCGEKLHIVDVLVDPGDF